MNKKLRRDIIKKRLIQEMEASGLSSAEIARRAGISATILCQYKTTSKLPSLVVLANLCEVIGADTNYILGITDN